MSSAWARERGARGFSRLAKQEKDLNPNVPASSVELSPALSGHDIIDEGVSPQQNSRD